MVDRRFPFFSLILGFISNLIAYFQVNLALLVFKLIFPGCGRTLSGYFRALPVSRGKRLDFLYFDFVFAQILTS